MQHHRSLLLGVALGAIDLALWDIKGKALNAPLYQPFGGEALEHIERYATSGSPQGIVPQREAQAMGQKERRQKYRSRPEVR